MRVNREKIEELITPKLTLAAMIYCVQVIPDDTVSLDCIDQIPFHAAMTLAQSIMSTGTGLYNELEGVVADVIEDITSISSRWIDAWTEQYPCDIYTCVRLNQNGRSKFKWAKEVVEEFEAKHFEQDILETIT